MLEINNFKESIVMRVWLFYKPFFIYIFCFVFFICRCHWKTEIGIYLKQRCCSPAYHFISPRGPQSEHSSISCGWSRCGIWKSNVCLSGNGLWGNEDSLTPCFLPSSPPPHTMVSLIHLSAFLIISSLCCLLLTNLFCFPNVLLGVFGMFHSLTLTI